MFSDIVLERMQFFLSILSVFPHSQEVVGKAEASEIEFDKMSPDDVVQELFDSTRREIIDEVNIPSPFLGQPQLMGIVRNMTNGGKPSSEYYTR